MLIFIECYFFDSAGWIGRECVFLFRLFVVSYTESPTLQCVHSVYRSYAFSVNFTLWTTQLCRFRMFSFFNFNTKKQTLFRQSITGRYHLRSYLILYMWVIRKYSAVKNCVELWPNKPINYWDYKFEVILTVHRR